MQAGWPSDGEGWLRFDRLGLATLRNRVFRFDEARNWHLVRTLIMDDQARVKWLFCSNELKARLLRYAARYERSAAGGGSGHLGSSPADARRLTRRSLSPSRRVRDQ